jgi:hypothetical protein
MVIELAKNRSLFSDGELESVIELFQVITSVQVRARFRERQPRKRHPEKHLEFLSAFFEGRCSIQLSYTRTTASDSKVLPDLTATPFDRFSVNCT